LVVPVALGLFETDSVTTSSSLAGTVFSTTVSFTGSLATSALAGLEPALRSILPTDLGPSRVFGLDNFDACSSLQFPSLVALAVLPASFATLDTYLFEATFFTFCQQNSSASAQ
jgi:hypothetical protein